MALDLLATYPSQLDASDPTNYPYGKAKNQSSPDDGTGTPWEEKLVNDFLGFQQALLKAAGVVPSGVPDNAVTSQYLISFYRLLGRADGWGALGDDATDDTAQLQAGLNAVAARGSGRQAFHFLDGKIYRCTGLNVPANVDLFFHGATLVNTHASNALLTYANGGLNDSRSPYQQVCDVTFSATVVTTGAAIRLIDETTKLCVRNAQYGSSSNNRGKFLDASDVGGHVRLESVALEGHADVQLVHIEAGILIAQDVSVLPPSTRTGALFEIGAAVAYLDDMSFNLAGHSTGLLDCVRISSASARVFVGAMEVSTGALADRAIAWTAAGLIVERGLRVNGSVVAYYGGGVGGVTLASGSRLSLRASRVATFSGATCSLPADCLVVVCRSTEPTGDIDLVFPEGYFVGQEKQLELSTSYGSGVVTPSITGPVTVSAAAMVGITAGYVQSSRFTWMDPSGGTSYRWVQTATWHSVASA